MPRGQRKTTTKAQEKSPRKVNRKKKEESEEEEEEVEEEVQPKTKSTKSNTPSKNTKPSSATPTPQKSRNSSGSNTLSQIQSQLLSLSQTQTSLDLVAQISPDEARETLNDEFLDLSVSTKELIQKMKKVSECLRKLKQPQKVTDLPFEKSFSKIFLDKRLFNSKDNEILLFTAISLADIFRLYAPEDPYTNTEKKNIFKFFIKHLRGLKDGENDPMFSQRFYLLERLATVKIMVVLTETELDAMNIIEELFESFYSNVDSKVSLPQKAISHMIDILVSVVEALDTFSEKIVQVILEPLSHEKKEEKSQAYQLSEGVLEKSADYIVTAISEQVKLRLLDLEKSFDRIEDASFKKKRSRLFRTIFELNIISNRLLLHIVSEFYRYLKNEDVNIRLSFVQLIGSMFAAKDSTLAREYNQLFDEFIHRFEDADSKIRAYMGKFAGEMLCNHNSFIKELGPKLEARIYDTDEKVRRVIVESICEVAKQYPEVITEKLMLLAGERIKDKKPQLRSHALNLIAQVYQHHSTDIIKGNEDWSEEFLKKFSWIPNAVIAQYNLSNATSDHRIYIESIIEDHLLPKKDATLRAKALVDVYSKLNSFEKGSLHRVLLVKKKFQKTLGQLINYEPDDSLDKEAEENRFTEKLTEIANFLLNPDQGRKVLRKIFGAKKDKETISFFEKCILSTSSYETYMKMKDEVDNASEKSDVNEFCKMVIRKSGMNIIAKDQIPIIFDLIQTNITSDTELVGTALDLFVTIASVFPELFVDNFDRLQKVLFSGNDEVIIEKSLRLLDQVGHLVEANDINTAGKLRPLLVKLATSKNIKHAKFASLSIAKIYAVFETIFSDIYEKHVFDLKFDEMISGVLVCLKIIANYAPAIYCKEDDMILDFLFDEILGKMHDKNGSTSWESVTLDTKLKILSIKLLGAHFVAKHKSEVSISQEDKTKRISEQLVRIIREKGKLFVKDLEDEEVHKEKAIDYSHFLLTAAKTVIGILSNPDSQNLLHLTLGEYLQLCFVATADSSQVRLKFAERLHKGLTRQVLGMKFAAALYLCVGDVNMKNASTAKALASFVVFAHREIQQVKKVKLTDQVAVLVYPEYILPYLIYLCSHHPSFEEQVNENNLMLFQRIFFAFFDEVCKDADNLTFFNHLIAKLKQTRDVQNLESTNILVMCDLAMAIVSRVCEGKSLLHSFPGQLFIPGMFAKRELNVLNNNREQERTINEQIIAQMKTLYLPQDFKIDEKNARKFVIKESGEVNTAKKKKKRAKTVTGKKRKSKKKSKEEAEEATSTTTSPKRAPSSRKAKQNKKYTEESESEEEEEEDGSEGEEEGEEQGGEEGQENDAKKDEMSDEEEEQEEEIHTKKRKRRKIA